MLSEPSLTSHPRIAWHLLELLVIRPSSSQSTCEGLNVGRRRGPKRGGEVPGHRPLHCTGAECAGRGDSPCSQDLKEVLKPIMLVQQYRMREPIAALPSLEWYDNKLEQETDEVDPAERDVLHLFLMKKSQEKLDGHSSHNPDGISLTFLLQEWSQQPIDRVTKFKKATSRVSALAWKASSDVHHPPLNARAPNISGQQSVC